MDERARYGTGLTRGEVVTRTSDVMRLLLAHENSLSYLDTDVLLLSPNASTYLHEFSAVAVWADSFAALEPTNSAFCLSRRRLPPHCCPHSRCAHPPPHTDTEEVSTMSFAFP